MLWDEGTFFGTLDTLSLFQFQTRMSVDEDIPFDFESGSIPEVEDVEKRRFSGAGSSHQRHQAARSDEAVDAAEDRLGGGTPLATP